MIPQALLAGGGADIYRSSVTSLLHFNGSVASTTITDELGLTWTAVGNTQLSNTAVKFGATSVYLDGVNDYINGGVDTQSPSAMSGDFTFEGWYNAINLTNPQPIAEKYGAAGNANAWLLYISATGYLTFISYDGTNAVVTLTSSASSVAGVWESFAVTKSGLNYYLFLNGTLVASGTASGAQGAAGQPMVLARWTGTAYTWYGYLDEIRMTKGVCRYTASYSPQNYPFP